MSRISPEQGGWGRNATLDDIWSIKTMDCARCGATLVHVPLLDPKSVQSPDSEGLRWCGCVQPEWVLQFHVDKLLDKRETLGLGEMVLPAGVERR